MTENDLEKLLAEKYPSLKYDDILCRAEHFPANGWEKYSTAVAKVIREETDVEELEKKLDEAISPGFLMFECEYILLD